MSRTYETLALERHGQVATISLGRIDNYGDKPPPQLRGVHLPAEFADALNELRSDQTVRVVVITGRGDVFMYPPGKFPWHGHPGIDWEVITAMGRAFEALIGTEKITIAKLNGPAVAFGSTVALACDFIIARDDAVLAYHHLAMGELVLQGQVRGPHDSGKVCGDGGMTFLPLHLPINMVKRVLMLGEPLGAKELVTHGMIYAAVPAAELDRATDELAERLLKRTAYGIAWTKRLLNQRLRSAYNMSFDAGIGYEFLSNYMQSEHSQARAEGRGVSKL